MHFYTLYYSTLCPDGENGHRRCRDSRFPKTVFTCMFTPTPLWTRMSRVDRGPGWVAQVTPQGGRLLGFSQLWIALRLFRGTHA